MRDSRIVLLLMVAVVVVSAVVLSLGRAPRSEFTGGPACIPASVQDC